MKNNVFVKTLNVNKELSRRKLFKPALSIDGTIIRNKTVKKLDCAIGL